MAFIDKMASIYESKYSKSNIIYDEHVGLAFEIEKTFKSPIKRYSNNSSGRSSPDNNSICCACLELIGGKLYTCTRCASSFHSICHFPPISIRDKGRRSDWLCNRCNTDMIFNRELAVIKTPLDVQQKEDVRNGLTTRFMLSQLVNQNTELDQLHDLSTALKAINAREFTLENLEVDHSFYKLPFDELYNKEEQIQCEKPCFYCKKFVESQMILCDYCSTTFCFDCLCPPITSLPNQRFMCPLHVERFLDFYMVNSLKVTERMDLWKKYVAHSGSEIIITAFLNFLRDNNPSEKKQKEHPNVRKTYRPTSMIKKKNTKCQINFNVNNLVKDTYAKILALNKTIIGTEDIHPSTSKDATATEVLLKTQNVESTEMHATNKLRTCNFFPNFFDESLPVYAALYIISGTNKNIDCENYVIPIQSTFFTLGLHTLKNHSIDLSQFSSCTALLWQQALVFFDKSKLAFEIVSTNLVADSNFFYQQKFAHANCKCTNSSKENLMHLSGEEILPSSRSAVLWNGAIIRIGCLRILFSCLGTL